MQTLFKNLSLVVALMGLQFTAFAETANAAANSWDFDVYLDDDSFGKHQVKMTRDGDRTEIVTNARFKYRLLFVTLYTYDHETTEVWQGDCVKSLNSTTDDNGDEVFVNASLEGETLEVETRDGKQSLDSCVRTFAYWDRTLLTVDKLLNTQNGKYQDANITDTGMSELVVEGKTIPARRIEIDSEAGLVKVWYDSDDRWIALESAVENGSIIRYIASDISQGADSISVGRDVES